MKDDPYPLARVLEIKKQRQERAEKELKHKQELLREEQELLKEAEEERDKAKDHKEAKLSQLRSSIDEGTTSDKVNQKKAYLKVCEELLEVEEQKVKEQQIQVNLAQKNVDAAKEEVRKRRLEVDKLKEHRAQWVKEYTEEIRREEDKQMGEVGEVIYNLRKRRGY